MRIYGETIVTAKSNVNIFARYYKDNIEKSNRQIRLPFRFGNNNSCVFSFKTLIYTVINLFLQKLTNLIIAKFTISTRTDITLQTSLK